VVTVQPRYPTCTFKRHRVTAVYVVLLVGLTICLWVEGSYEWVIVILVGGDFVPH